MILQSRASVFSRCPSTMLSGVTPAGSFTQPSSAFNTTWTLCSLWVCVYVCKNSVQICSPPQSSMRCPDKIVDKSSYLHLGGSRHSQLTRELPVPCQHLHKTTAREGMKQDTISHHPSPSLPPSLLPLFSTPSLPSPSVLHSLPSRSRESESISEI